MTYSLELSKMKKGRGCSFGSNRIEAINASYIPLERLKVIVNIFRILVQGIINSPFRGLKKIEDFQ